MSVAKLSRAIARYTLICSAFFPLTLGYFWIRSEYYLQGLYLSLPHDATLHIELKQGRAMVFYNTSDGLPDTEPMALFPDAPPQPTVYTGWGSLATLDKGPFNVGNYDKIWGVRRCGIGVGRFHHGSSDFGNLHWNTLYLEAPIWVLVFATAIVPCCVLARLIAKRRANRGGCQGCGYDLRASVGRCPECGRPFDATTHARAAARGCRLPGLTDVRLGRPKRARQKRG